MARAKAMAHFIKAHGLSFIVLLAALPSIVCHTSTCDIKYLVTTVSRYIPESDNFMTLVVFGEPSNSMYSVTTTVQSENGIVLYNTSNMPMYGDQYKQLLRSFPLTSDTKLLLLTVIIKRNTGNGECKNSSKIPVSQSTNMRFFIIQTDRPWYTPGQRVRFKIFIPSRDTVPRESPTGHVNFSVTITDPENNIMYQELLTKSVYDIIDVNFQLPRYAITGIWKISCNFYSAVDWKSFTVKKQVINRFEVSLLDIKPASISPETSMVESSVVARYTFGKYVTGILRATFELGYSDDENSMLILEGEFCAPASYETQISGKKSIFCNMKSAVWQLSQVTQRAAFLVIKANVTESGTGITQPSKPVLLKLIPRVFKTEIYGDKYFKRGVAYTFTVLMKTVADTTHKLTNELWNITWRTSSQREKLEDSDCIKTDVLTCQKKFNVTEIVTIVAGIGRTRDSVFRIRPWHSNSGKYLTLHNPSLKTPLPCSGTFTVHWFSTFQLGPKTKIYAQVYGRGGWPFYGKLSNLQNGEQGVGTTGTFTFIAFELMAPEATMLAYYATDDGEIVSDAIKLTFQRCLPLKVTLSTDRTEYAPGDSVSVYIKAKSSSKCLISVLDKGIYFGENSTFNETSRIFSILNKYESPLETEFSRLSMDVSYCRPIRDQEAYTDSVDASDSFITARVTVITNLQLNTRACKYRPRYRPTSLTKEEESSENQRSSDLIERTNFDETFLWKTVEIENSEHNNGHSAVIENVPHSITQWIGKAMCIHKTQGFGLSNHIQFSTFKRLFISLSLPYTVIRGETVALAVHLHNYFGDDLKMKLNITFHQGVITSLLVCARANHVFTHTFLVTPRSMGLVPVEAEAVQVDADIPSCRDNAQKDNQRVKDIVKKQLFITAPGVPTDISKTAIHCLKEDETNKQFSVELRPDNSDRQTLSAHISVSRDCFSLTIANMERQIRPAFGCAEQTTSSFAPMIFALHYLSELNALNNALLNKAQHFISAGINELNYFWRETTSNQGSYCYFNNDTKGDIWLTAFIFKCLNFAKRFVHIDQEKLDMVVAFLKGLTKDYDRCIMETTKYSYLWGHYQFSQKALTAYVLIALLEAGEDAKDDVIRNMFQCFERSTSRNENDFHEQAIIAYAYSLKKGEHSTLNSLIDRLLNADERRTFWPAQFPSKQIETSAYVLLTLLHKSNPRQQEIAAMIEVSGWLVRQGDSYGKFLTTQTTSLVSQALSGLSQVPCFGTPMKIEVTPDYHNQTKTFTTTCKNRALFIDANDDLTTTNNVKFKYDVRISGTGCSCITIALRYHQQRTTVDALDNPLSLRITTNPTLKRSATLKICARYSSGRIDMTMIEVRVVTGWYPVSRSLDESVYTQHIRHYEIIDNFVHLYFEKFTTSETCINLELICDISARAENGVVHAYAYYRPEISTYHEYQLPECKSNSPSSDD